MKNKKYYGIILAYGILLLTLLVGFNNIYGSSIDWSTQHTVIPDYFRKLFYETGSLLPNFAFSLGSGQNIFNFSYYGLLNPYILLSYLFPFLKMEVYISILGIILYLSSGLLLFKFLTQNNFSNKISLLSSFALLSLAPLTYHFHYQIMFVWTLPFLILSLIGVDKYLNENKSFLLISSIFLLILTNYYFAVSSLIVIAIYGIYKLLKKKSDTADFFKALLKAFLRVLIAILLAGFFLLPTIYVLLQSPRQEIVSPSTLSLFVFNIKNIFYLSYTPGISMIFIIALLGFICSKKKQKEDIFLSITLLIITFLPLIMYILNGFLYVRGKSLIPFAIIYIYALVEFISKLEKDNINFKKLLPLAGIVIIYILITNYTNKNFYLLILDMIVTLFSIFIYSKKKNLYYIYLPLLIILVSGSFISNESARYITKSKYQKISSDNIAISSLLKNIADDSFYRIDTNADTELNMNRVWNNNSYSSSMYSSSYNPYYQAFYTTRFANNIIYRNNLMTSNTANPLFYNFMGIKYIVTKEENINNYDLVATRKDYNLYKNQNAFPIIYTTSNYGSKKDYNSLSFPYNLEYMLNLPVTSSKKTSSYTSKIKELPLEKSNYNLHLAKEENYHYDLSSPVENEYLLISFDIKNDNSCKNGDVSITINGVMNKLTCKEWYYYNNNKTFEYVLYNKDGISSLDINITKGTYEIENLKAYTMPFNYPENITSLKNIKIDKKSSTITGEAAILNDSYLISSIPYDKGFKTYIDGKEVNPEIVNSAFLGFKVPSGTHKIKIVYSSPLYKEGLIITICGVFFLIATIIIERKKNCQNK